MGRVEETPASLGARSAPRPCPTARRGPARKSRSYRDIARYASMRKVPASPMMSHRRIRGLDAQQPMAYGTGRYLRDMAQIRRQARRDSTVRGRGVAHRRSGIGPSPISVDVVEARHELSQPRRRSARLIARILKEAGTAEGPEDLAAHLRQYLYHP